MAFDEIFEFEREIPLEEPDSVLITAIRWLAVSEDGRFAIPDAMEAQVRVYGPHGSLLASLGRRGEGPGEFMTPHAVAFADDGALYVADHGSPRVTRFSPSLELDTTFLITEAQKIHGVAGVGGGFATGHVTFPARFADGRDTSFLNLYDRAGRRRTGFYRVPDSIFQVPYWFSATVNMGTSGYVFAVSDDRVIIGTSLLYPLTAFTANGKPLGTIGHPPPSWLQASRPEPGAFRPPNQMATFQAWLRSYTTIHRLALLGDGMLLVVHRKLNPEVLAYEEPHYTLDAYDRGGNKVWEEVALPGELLTATGQYAYVLSGEAPETWMLAIYKVGSR